MQFNAHDLKKMLLKPVKGAVNRIDMEKVFDRIANSRPGRAWSERLGPAPAEYSDQEDIILKTVELTVQELAERGDRHDRSEVEDYARLISCRYDQKLHNTTQLAVFSALEHIFKHDDLNQLFISEDRRELAHLEALRQARRNGTGIVFLVNHSSHLDEFIADVVLRQQNIGLPLFAAGANMMATPSLEKILMVGSYLIIRRGATKTYLSTLFNYCRALTELGKMQGIFLEAWSGGARTRDGSLRYPRRLVTLQGSLASANDVLVQPVSISYSAVPEDLSLAERSNSLCWINGWKFYRNLLRQPHHPIRAAWRGMEGVYNRAFLTLCRPRLLSELDEMRSANPGDMTRDEFVALYSMKEIARDKKIMSSHLAARALIRAREDGLSDLEEAARLEMAEMVDYHQRNFGQEPDFEDLIRKAPLKDVLDDGLTTLGRRKILERRISRSGLPKVKAKNTLQYYATHADRRLYSPSAKANSVIIGAGAWGYGLACLVGNRTLTDRKFSNSSLTIFDARANLVSSIADTRFHPAHFPEIRLPKNVFITSDVTAAYRKVNEAVIAAPVEMFEKEFKRLLADAHQPLNVIIATRGFDQVTNRLPIQIAEDVLAESGRTDVTLFVLSGPVTPDMLAENRGGWLVLAGPEEQARHLSDMFKHPPFRVHVCDDPIGVQVAGTMTQVYTVLGGYYRRNKTISQREQIASFVTETSEEAISLALILGGKADTFRADNPAWVGEYVAAGLGGPSVKFGLKAGGALDKAKKSAREIPPEAGDESQKETGYRIIGYTGIRSAYILSHKLGLRLPHLEEAYRIFWAE